MTLSKPVLFSSVAVIGFLSSVSPVFAKHGPTNTPTPTPVRVVCHEIKHDGKCEVSMRTSCTGKYLAGPCVTPTPVNTNTPTPTTIPEATLTPTPTPVAPSVPEFGLITGALALAASIGSFGLLKKKI